MTPAASNLRASKLATFHLVGDRSGLPSQPVESMQYRPALFADYRDLSRLRYDYPLILGSTKDGEWVRSLADSIDFALQRSAAEGTEGEEIRRQVLNLEQEIRNLVAGSETGSLASLWEQARAVLLKEASDPSAGNLLENLAKVQSQLGFDGEVIDCDAHLSFRMIKHAWKQSQQQKSIALQKRINRLLNKLTDILKVDSMHSGQARDVAHLENSLGTGDSNVFDFQAMSQILKSAPVGNPLPESRQLRINAAIKVLEAQQFVNSGSTNEIFEFSYTDCSTALTAFQQRLPAMAAVVKAISIAELEIENRYVESKHDAFYANFDEDHLGPEDLALFPVYLITIEDADDPINKQAVLELLGKGLPFKIVAHTNNIFGDISTATGQLSFGTQGQQLASMAMGLNTVFVMQSAASALYHLRDAITQGLGSDCPALFSVFTGAVGEQAPYLLAAAAIESRAFPVFVFDPATSEDMALRFCLDGNPHCADDWSRSAFRYEDAEHNKQLQETAFTLVDFMVCDKRLANHFVSVSAEQWNQDMLPADTFMQMDAKSRLGKIPFVLLIDENNVLHRAVCDVKLIDAAHRCQQSWHSLQELGGINNSHARQALAQAKAEWEVEKQQLIEQASVQNTTATVPHAPEINADIAAPAAQPSADEPTAAVAEVSSDDPWIETIRCTTCNECTELNDRMFAYDADKRAYIKDPDAGTYLELVEAAETCQVAIIHPGKPRNPDEPGLEDLLERAELFD